jgi:OOP family OmpA-OmpF porin
VDDACPMVPEDMDSDSDADGCPEESGSVCVDINFSGRVQFETDSDEIKPESFAELNLAASTIKSNDVLKLIEVQGHTDNRGSDSYNEALSQRRAESVRRYLIEQGVDGDRLRAKGYGESEPVDRDETEAAWAKNRRVVFVVVERTDNCPVDPT